MSVIKHEDIIPKGDPLKEFKASLAAANKLVIEATKSNKEYAESLNLVKKSSDGAEAKKLVEIIDKLKKSTVELTAVQKQELKIEKQLETAKAKLSISHEKQAFELARIKNEQAEANKEQKKSVQASREVTSSLKGQRIELSKLTDKYDNLSKEQRENTKIGGKLRTQINQVSESLKKNEAATNRNQRSVGKYTDALKGVAGQLFGGLGVTAGIALLKDQFNKASERATILNKSTNRLKGTFDITTRQAKLMAGQINAISTSFEDADTQKLEVSLSAIIGSFKDISEQEALNLIEEGFLKGSNNSGEFLDILREYPSFFAKAGVSASQMFAIINQQVKSGVYSDKGVDAIKEATIQLTENTKIVQDALRPLGESINLQIRQKVEAGKAFEAMQLITSEMEKLGNNSAETQTIIADVFKGAGEDSELFVKNLHNVELNLKGVAIQTTANQAVNLELAKSYNKFINVVGDSEGFLSNFFAGVKFKLSGLLEDFADFFTDTVGLKIQKRQLDENEKSLTKLRDEYKKLSDQNKENTKEGQSLAANILRLEQGTRRLTLAEKKLIAEQKNAEKERKKNEKEEEKRRKKKERESEAQIKRIKRESDAAEKAEAKRRRLDMESSGTNVQGVSIDDAIESEHQASLNRIAKMNDDARKEEALQEIAASNARKARAIEIEAALGQIKDAAIGAAGQILSDSISFGIDAEVAAQEAANNEKIERQEALAEVEKSILEQKLADGLITETQFKEQSAVIDEKLRNETEKLEKDTKTKQAEADKKKALFDVGIATAVGIARVIPNPIAMALAAVLGGIQLAAVAARPIPKFAKGGEVGGESHANGGTLIEAEKKEFVLSKEGYSGAEGISGMINKGLIKDSDIELMKNTDHYSSNILELNGLISEVRSNGYLTKETNKLLSKSVNIYDRGSRLIVTDINGNVLKEYTKN